MRRSPLLVWCMNCHKEMLIPPSRIAENRGKFCSRICQHIYYATHDLAKRHATRKNGHHRFDYQVLAEMALGRPLRRGEVVHHVDGNPRNNERGNLVICTQSFHRFLHMRQTALDATGNAKSKKCPFCKRWGLPENMMPYGSSMMRHSGCYYKKEVSI